jgi:hypothetical protein
MATIEPRLMHLLNDSQSDLPPIQDSLTRSDFHSLSLPSLEPDGGIRSDYATSKQHYTSQQSYTYYSTGDDLPISIPIRESSRRHGSHMAQEATPHRSSKKAHSLQLLLDDTEEATSSISLRRILEDTQDVFEDSGNKKRHRAMAVKEDFVQLPQPLKKQKSTQQVVPPIINGLHEPPPEAAMFPPISSERAFGDGDMTQMALLKEPSGTQEDRHATGMSEADRAKAKRKATKPRRKWSEEETNHLLLGVSRHGVGKWTTILEDPDFHFDERTAGDLKDRFRTCCPDELRSSRTGHKLRKESSSKKTASSSRSEGKKSMQLEDLLIATERSERKQSSKHDRGDNSSSSKPKKSRAHRKKLEDLAELGIQGPFKKSHRRERRPFTEQDDREILEGLEQYGPAWTKIQRDPKFELSSRQPTDLRDRVRNKYPDVYARIEKGHFSNPELGPGTSLLEPSVNMTIENSLTSGHSGGLEQHLPRTSSKEELLRWSSSSNLLDITDASAGVSSGYDLSEQTSSSMLVGGAHEMDISRLLLDDGRY